MAGLADVALRAEWKFGRKRAAVLVMYRPRLDYIPFARFRDRLVDTDRLHNKDVVTDVYSCPAFGLCLSGKSEWMTNVHGCLIINQLSALSAGNETVALTLRAAPPMSPAGGQLQPAWSSQNFSGIYQAAGNANGSQADFIPLFCLKRIPGAGFWDRFCRGESDPESVNDDQ